MLRSELKSANHKIARIALTGWLGMMSLLACGPDFPNTLLDGGDRMLLVAPEGDFRRELGRLCLRLPRPRFPSVLSTNGPTALSVEAELADLNLALTKTGIDTAERESFLKRHRAEREKLGKYLLAQEPWHTWSVRNDDAQSEPPPKPADIGVIDGLPGEFADYFRGMLAFAGGETNAARQAWRAVLGRPANERRFRSVWAAYMLGRSCVDDAPEEAIRQFHLTRELVSEGFSDRLGLAAASLGWEARAELNQKHWEQSIELYLQQLASGDESAALSLRQVAVSVFKEDAGVLRTLATNPRTRWALTAYLISRRSWPWDESGARREPAEKWLDAVEAADVRDVDSAEQLALAAYQAGAMEIAQRWIERARRTPATQWLQAKLLLRAGKMEAAARLLARVSAHFPIEETAGASPDAGTRFENNLRVSASAYNPVPLDAARQVLGELGALKLARREFVEALDALLRAGFWTDAAYVAERVLTVDELKSYVDRNWIAPLPGDEPAERDEAEAGWHFGRVPPARLGREIRYLLARRLVRLSHCFDAREYFPATWQSRFDEFVQALGTGEDGSLPAERRAAGFFAAAKMARRSGMELMGTEVEPDWHVYGGDFDEGTIGGTRAKNRADNVVAAGTEELRRISVNRADPDARFHYRYQAAFLALEAARLLPDNTDETARILCMAGAWLKVRDPQTADLFYKLLVRRCRHTAIGAEADRKRWFPQLDEKGNLAPPTQPAPAPEPPADEAAEAGNETAPEEPIRFEVPNGQD